MNGTSVIFDPFMPWPVLAGMAFAMAALLFFAQVRGLSAAWIRGIAAAVILFALANPSLQEEDRNPLTDIVLVVVDDTASQRISDRQEQTETALAELSTDITNRPNTEMRVVRVDDGPEDAGTLLLGAMGEALAEIPSGRLAGVILLTDGQVHDIAPPPALPAPMHVLLTGRDGDWDRRLTVTNAPAFGILDEEIVLTLRIEDQGDVPGDQSTQVPLSVAIDGAEPLIVDVPIGRDIDVPLTLDHGGMNVVQLSVPEAEGELTDRNNAAVVQINGVRDRLRVLLVSGEPHVGERTWRNLLKSDSSVDLVHFTILRPPEKQDGVPVAELSLIAFPTRELFLEKIDDFDLIIFDKYRRRGILPTIYLDNVARYVERGGAVLVAAGPDYASANSIYRSPLADVLPGEPTAQVIEQGFTPVISDVGHRHPVTEGLAPVETEQSEDEAETPWGRWFRMVEVAVPEGQGDIVMTGPGERPLLILRRVDEGRVALLTSDHAWLWSRGFEGGGPQLELLRRLAHWTMQEPELEEDALIAEADGQTMTITRRSLEDGPREVTIVGPDGSETVLRLEEAGPGRATTTFEAPEPGLYRLTEGDMERVIALGPSAPREFEETIATGEKLEPAVAASRGGIQRLEDGVPSIRDVREGRLAAGRGWIGLLPRDAALITDLRISPLIAAWLFLALASLLTIAAWLREGRGN